MNRRLWKAVDDYFMGALAPPDPELEYAWNAGRVAGLPMHQSISPSQGRFLTLQTRAVRAQRVLEIGTLAGYSTIWLARGVIDGGRILTLEHNREHAEVARRSFAHARLNNVIDIRIGEAADTLNELIQQRQRQGTPAYDLIFIDADKQNNRRYFEQALELSRPGTVILVDNMVREGRILNPASSDPGVLGVRELTSALRIEPRVQAGVVQTVTAKRHDGFAMIVVEE